MAPEPLTQHARPLKPIDFFFQCAVKFMRIGFIATLLLCWLSADVGGCSDTASLATSTISSDLRNISPKSSKRQFLLDHEPAIATLKKPAIGLMRDAKAEAYLRGIVVRLMDHWNGEMPQRVGIFISTDDGVQGYSTASGDILIPIGAFNGIDSEDELATLIGHELGHIVLKHHEAEKTAKQIADAGTYAVMGAIIGSSVANGEGHHYGNSYSFAVTNPQAVQRDAIRAMLAQEAMVTLTQDLVLSEYLRQHEYQADVFGVTLAGNAGWDPRGLSTLARGWIDAEEQRRADLKEMMANSGTANSITQSIGQLAAQITDTHPDVASRQKNIASAIQTAFPGIPPPTPTKAPYTAAINNKEFLHKRAVWRDLNKANILLRKGKYDEAAAIAKAWKNDSAASHPDSRLVLATVFASLGTREYSDFAYTLIRTADLRQPASLNFYEHAIREHAYHSNWSDGTRVADAGEKFYGDETLPMRLMLMRLQAASMKTVPEDLSRKMASFSARCQQSADDNLRKSCNEAQTGTDADEESKTCGGVISMMAAWVPNGGNNCNSGGAKALTDTISSAPTSVLTNIFGAAQ